MHVLWLLIGPFMAGTSVDVILTLKKLVWQKKQMFNTISMSRQIDLTD